MHMKRECSVVFACALLAATILCASCGGQGPSQPTTSSTTTPVSPLPLTIAAPDAFSLVQSNATNPQFVILDVRTAGEFASGYIAGAIEIDYHADDFRSRIGTLSAAKRYLVYCERGDRGAAATATMAALSFTQVQNLAGGLDQWLQDGYPVVAPVLPLPLPLAITTLDAFALVESKRSRPDFVILDVRTAAEFAGGHIAGAIDIDYYSADFRSRVQGLDSGKRYLVYCRTGVRGAASTEIMVALGFQQVQNLTGGLLQWMQDGYPTVN